MMKKVKRAPSKLSAAAKNLTAAVAGLAEARPEANPQANKTIRKSLEKDSRRLETTIARLDPIVRPSSSFDPSHPDTAGKIVAMTLAAQPRHKLDRLPMFYGAGVYAIYYKGPFKAYRPLVATEHPIYVGKADPAGDLASTPVEQGVSLSKRLREHAKRIIQARSTLNLADFECRFLICRSGVQAVAEKCLIEQFKPIWNSETKICFGMSKHGDAASTRANARSPWFTMHPGVPWADDPQLPDQKKRSEIEADLAAHFRKHPPFKNVAAIFDSLLASLKQMEVTDKSTPVPLTDEADPD